MRKYFFLTCCLLISNFTNAQEVLSSTFLRTYTKAYFFSQFTLQVSYDVSLYRIKYSTVDVKGQPTVASGLVCLPDDKKTGYPVAMYHHGTVASRFDVPSYGSFEQVLPSIIAGFGFIGMCPDYLGLGDSPGIHPYVHAASQVTASRDMLIAGEKFIYSQGYNTTKDLVLSGYSQGGHASMGFHRYLEKNKVSNFKLKGASHMSGPYAISTGMRDLLLSDANYMTVAYLANVALSYNLVYGIFKNNDLKNFFKPTYAKMVEKFAKEETDLWKMNAEMLDSLKAQYGKTSPKYMVIDSIVANILSDSNHIVNKALKDNDVYDFKSTIPTRLLYCKADDQVVFTNSLIAEAKMKANGSTQVQAFDVRSGASHTECINPASTSTLFFLSQYAILSDASDLEENKFVSIYPNPASTFVNLKSDDQFEKVMIMDITGKINVKNVINNSFDIQDLDNGLYLINAENQNGKSQIMKLVISK
jgi:hypothetical protein